MYLALIILPLLGSIILGFFWGKARVVFYRLRGDISIEFK